MNKTEDAKVKTANDFYKLLADEQRSILNYHTNAEDTPLYPIGGWPRGGSGHEFQGYSALQLMTASSTIGFTDPRWFTQSQLRRAGLYIKKGESAQVHVEKVYQDPETKEYKRVLTPMFNGDQIKGLPEAETKTEAPKERYKRIEAFIKSTGANIAFDPKNAPYYDRQADVINMADLTTYNKERGGPQEYYKDLMYAMVEWASHPSRGNTLQPADLGTQQDSAYRLRHQFALLALSARLGVGYEADNVSEWEQNFIKDQPHWRNLEDATNDAQKLLNVLNVPPRIYEPLPDKQQVNEVKPTFDPLMVVHVADKPSKKVAQKIKQGIQEMSQ
ncbi:zincin-like metallopeptidase domain-containing protein [Pseudoxanthomonas winnipegensis]|uniref:DUF1738 domain-containing protein n=1 Tax=Pseudoxanthomonas winnipegensis TaxID=2480810 RepID=A0A4Q8M500_9GAMM|nr:zincin-like metallopeptidase domain-containing protein [Pseudoxanthomonas winnipegensis]TAA41574.1 DUF1738 domain-containing protein [Pseudoxanthomonas winnipegensis]